MEKGSSKCTRIIEILQNHNSEAVFQYFVYKFFFVNAFTQKFARKRINWPSNLQWFSQLQCFDLYDISQDDTKRPAYSRNNRKTIEFPRMQCDIRCRFPRLFIYIISVFVDQLSKNFLGVCFREFVELLWVWFLSNTQKNKTSEYETHQ